jgi:hypothetical protein
MIKLVDRAREAGLGDIEMVMECTSFQGETMMMDEAGQADVPSRFSPNGESGVPLILLGRGKRMRRRGVRMGDRGGILQCRWGVVRSGDMDRESGDGGGNDEDEDDEDEEDMELSDCEWAGWMRDLDRQGLVEWTRMESSPKAESSANGGGARVVVPPPHLPAGVTFSDTSNNFVFGAYFHNDYQPFFIINIKIITICGSSSSSAASSISIIPLHW